LSTASSSDSSGDESDEPLVKKEAPPTVRIAVFVFCFFPVGVNISRWLYSVECPQYSIQIEALGYICTQAVYFLHSSRLMSRDSVVDDWLPATE